MNRIYIATALLLLTSTFGAAQVKDNYNYGKGKLDGQFEMITQMVWRGLLATDNTTMLPTLRYSLPNWRFGLYGIYDFQQRYKEVDLEVAYINGDFEFCATDFYMPAVSDQITRLFDLKPETTCHVLDVYVKYSPHMLPIWAYVATMPYGMDRIDGRQCFSSYCELAAYHTFPLDIFASLQAGASLGKGMYTLYQDGGFNIVNLCGTVSKDFKVGDVAIPAKIIYTFNPYTKLSVLAFSMGIRL